MSVDAEAAARRRAARRAAALTHHPDRGGDLEAFLAAMDAADAPPETRPATAATVTGVTRRPGRRRWRAARRAGARLVGDARRRLPRGFPGARRYGRL